MPEPFDVTKATEAEIAVWLQAEMDKALSQMLEDYKDKVSRCDPETGQAVFFMRGDPRIAEWDRAHGVIS